DLDDTARAEMERHLESNPQLRKLVGDLTQTRTLVRGLPRARAPVDIGESLGGQIERQILLGADPISIAESVRKNRWPQLAAVAAERVARGVVVRGCRRRRLLEQSTRQPLRQPRRRPVRSIMQAKRIDWPYRTTWRSTAVSSPHRHPCTWCFRHRINRQLTPT